MKLTVYSNYGSEEKIISLNASSDLVNLTMNSIDWKKFHQVVLTKSNGDYMEVGGNITDDGLSVMYEESGNQFIIIQPPTSVDQMTNILESYFLEDGKFKLENKFS